MNFHIFRIPIRVGLSFWLFMGLIGLIFTRAYELQFEEGLILVAGFLVIVFFSLFFQAVLHGCLGRKLFGSQPIALFEWFGSNLVFLPPPSKRSHRIISSLTGPMINLVLGLIFRAGLTLISVEFPHKETSLLTTLLEYGMLINAIWFVFNILPVMPLPGGHLLLAVTNSTKVSYIVSVILGVCLIIAAVLFKQIIIAFFFGLMTHQNFKALQMLKLHGQEQEKEKQETQNDEDN